MWEYTHYDELYHHGVKGMRWGVRRYQKKDGSLTRAGKRRLYKEIKEESGRLYKTEYDRLLKEYDIEGKRQAAYDYGTRHKLDLDDGGGGSYRAGKKYMDMWDEIDKLDTKAMENAQKYERKQLNSKFGEQAIKDFDKREQKIQNAQIAVTTSTMMLIPIATVVGLIATDPNMRK